MTKKLYLDNQYLREFSSTVSQKIETGERSGIILARTLFYPTSGGQPHDIGTINDIPVVDVFEDESHQIIHLLKEPVAGEEVEGRINWQRRFDHMQQHTGQHLLSQAFMKVIENHSKTVILFGAKAEGKASLFFLRSEEVACDMGNLMQDACAVINGHGGGRPQQAQGGGPATDKLESALHSAYLNFTRILTSNE